MAPTLLGRPNGQKQHECLYWEFHEGGFKQAVRVGQWKAVRPGSKAPVELYDLSKDLSEKNNIAADHADLVEKANGLFATCRTESPHWKVKG